MLTRSGGALSGSSRPRASGRRTGSSRFRCGGFCRLSSRFLLSQFVEMLANELRVPEVERTGVRLLFRDADLRQVLDQNFGLDLKFPGQLINSNLIRI